MTVVSSVVWSPGCLQQQLLKVDDYFLLPLLATIQKASSGERSGFITRSLQTKFVSIMIDFLSEAISNRDTPVSDIENIGRRLDFFQENLLLLEAERPPKRGLQHMIEPRIHWLIDLGFIDLSAFCSKGEISPPRSGEETEPCL